MLKIAVLGGGAAGIAAAISAKKHGADAVLIEKNSRIGKKLLMTGNGKCNFSNINITENDYNSSFVRDALDAFTPYDAIDFFREMGMLSRIDKEGRAYPASAQASAVLEILVLELERLGVRVICDFDVKEVSHSGSGFVVKALDGRTVSADRVIAAFGGMAAPKTGSDGQGYKILQSLGHSIIGPEKSLVQLKTDKKIKGVRAYARVTLKEKTSIGEVQFTEYGLSGIPVFDLSKYAKEGDSIYVDLLPDCSREELTDYLKGRNNQKLETYLVGIVNKQLGQMLMKDCGIGKLSRESSELTDKEITTIAEKIKNWKFTVTGKMPWDNAQVTAGGINTDEICPKTMESKIVKGLYFAGEVADVDGPCGGYNLQWAWSSGIVSGKSAAGGA